MSVLLQALGEALLNSELLLKGAGGGAFLLYNAGTWRPHHFAVWGLVVLLGASSRAWTFCWWARELCRCCFDLCTIV